jgi:hypothetical protein
MAPSTISRLLTQYDNLQCYLLYLVWNLNNFCSTRVGGQYWIPVVEQQNVEADHYYLTRTYLLPAYMADWILLSK